MESFSTPRRYHISIAIHPYDHTTPPLPRFSAVRHAPAFDTCRWSPCSS